MSLYISSLFLQKGSNVEDMPKVALGALRRSGAAKPFEECKAAAEKILSRGDEKSFHVFISPTTWKQTSFLDEKDNLETIK